jgi:photosystem II stability/assembly factor-like uncharacterized protein
MRCVIGLVLLGHLSSAQASAQTVTSSMLNGLEWRSIGPAATGGRIADIAVSQAPGQPFELYVGTTSGGIFKSSNEGVSFTPIFDHAGGMMSMGAVAVAPSNPSVVWAGTGEADNRQSSSWGDGAYKSLDGGQSWQKMGLGETRHIGKILIHPADPNTVYVAAVGHLWGSNAERGVFKTTDGGKSWRKVLYKDENTGAIDLAMDPRDPNVVFAAMYQRQRKGWGFNGGGPGSGIYRTTDGGSTWIELTRGLPAGDKGRIGLAAFAGDGRTVYAIVEADTTTGEGAPGGRGGRGAGGGRGGRGGPASAGIGGVFRSLDRGETWEHMSGLDPRPCYYSRIYVDPKDANRVYIMGSNRGFYISDDAGRNFREVFSGVHGEDHVLWIDPGNTNRLVIGGDGGVSISYDRGLTWLFRLNLPIGQFYTISANNQNPFLICGGLQDNGNWCTPSASRTAHGISFKDAYNIGGGDGMYSQFEGDDHTLLVSLQNGNTARVDLDSMQRQNIGPVAPAERPKPGDPGFRWYWTTPIVVSAFDAKTIYTGANELFRSDDRGVTWRAISSDLTARIDREKLSMMGGPVPARAFSRHDGQSNFSALTAIAESPLDRELLYTGADDGTIHVTRDGGHHWTDLSNSVRGLPPMLNISSITASKHAAGRVYLTVDGHFNDDYHPYVYVSEDYGKSWRPIVEGLPISSVHRLREHSANPNFLAIGTEMGAYVTLDRGTQWTTVGGNLPPVPVYDLLFQESQGALVLGTHGRSIWVLDHIEPVAQMTSEVLKSGGYLFPVPVARQQVIYNGQYWFGAGEFFASNPAYGAAITYFLPQASASVEINIADEMGKTVRTLHGSAQSGLNRTHWDLRQAPASSGLGPKVLPGLYTVTVLPPGGAPLKARVTVEGDPRFPVSDADRRARHEAVMNAYALQQQLLPARDAAQTLGQQLTAMAQYLSAAGDGSRSVLSSVDKVSPEVTRLSGEISRTLNAAGRVEEAIDGYDGLPTTQQLRELGWAWEDGTAAVTALNKLIERDMPPVYTALGNGVKWPEVKAVAAPTRSK